MSKKSRVFDLLLNYQSTYNNKVMVAGKVQGVWKKYTTDEFTAIVNNLSKGLLAKGYKKGDRIGIMSGNRPEWSMVEFACSQLGIATVPLYPTLSTHDLSFIVKDSSVKLIFTSNEELAKRIFDAKKEHNLILELYTFEPVEAFENYNLIIQQGKSQDYDLSVYQEAVQPDDLFTLIYTSGTTGTPKGVYLSHSNLISNVVASAVLIPKDCKVAVSFLPLSHIFERMVSMLYFSAGIAIYYIENLDNVVAEINEVKPDCFTTVPRVLEKVYDKIVAKGKELTGIKKALFFWALSLGAKYQEPPKNPFFYKLKLGIARKLIFSKWKDALGGNIKIIISGGAALQERLARAFWAAGIKVLEGYGLTETSPVIAVNTWEDDKIRFGTVGRPLSNVEVKIAEDGEILTKGPNVTVGYYKNDAATAEAFDAEGYFKTGDIGELSSDGYLRITDRKKEIFKTAGGKYIAPQVIENKMMESVFIAQIMVIGENKKFPAAFIIPNYEQLEKWAHSHQITFSSHADLISNPAVEKKYLAEVARLSTNYGHWEIIKKVKLLEHEWTIQAGQLTPKLSLKRKIILADFAQEIAQIYEEQQ